MQAQSFGATAGIAMNQTQASGSMIGGTQPQFKQRVKARRGQATDPHNIAERVYYFSLIIASMCQNALTGIEPGNANVGIGCHIFKGNKNT
ncbi:hypothetical protein PTKIN_Ptkin02bG0076900 [Pterospermum kingtungense]